MSLYLIINIMRQFYVHLPTSSIILNFILNSSYIPGSKPRHKVLIVAEQADLGSPLYSASPQKKHTQKRTFFSLILLIISIILFWTIDSIKSNSNIE